MCLIRTFAVGFRAYQVNQAVSSQDPQLQPCRPIPGGVTPTGLWGRMWTHLFGGPFLSPP